MLADVGLIGFPSVGKSSVLARISAARPKIAEYHFTTLSPNLGVVRVHDEAGFVAADIPGLLEGAAEGAGLGHDFLRHIDRCRLLLHVVDISCYEGRDPIDDIKTINQELLRYSPALSERPQIILANKCDILDPDLFDVEEFEEFVRENGWQLMYISAATGEGLQEMIETVYDRLQTLPPIKTYEAETIEEEEIVGKETVIRREGGRFVVEGQWIFNLMNQVNFDDYESLNYFQRVLQKGGVFEQLEAAGCQDGDTVSMYEFEFDYVK
jgi:GTP-binding protein